MSWTRAAASPNPSPEAGASYKSTQAEHKKPRTSADFLPVDPTLSLGEDAERRDAITERDAVDMETLEQWVARRTKEFNVKTRERPNCEELWLQFADFQEEAVRALHCGGETSVGG